MTAKSPARSKRGECPGCRRVMTIFRRGLCGGCYADRSIRAAAPVLAAAAPPVDVAERNRVLSDPEVCPPALMQTIATRIAWRCSWWVDLDDLVQAGWLVLVKSAASWMRAPHRGAKTLIHYCLKGIKAAMYAAAVEPCSGGVTNAPDDWHVRDPRRNSCFVTATGEEFASAAEWHAYKARRIDANPTPMVSRHALDRYRERINPSGTAADVIRAARAGRPADDWESFVIRKNVSNVSDFIHIFSGGNLYVVGERFRRGLLRPVVVTVITGAMFEECAVAEANKCA